MGQSHTEKGNEKENENDDEDEDKEAEKNEEKKKKREEEKEKVPIDDDSPVLKHSEDRSSWADYQSEENCFAQDHD